MPETAPKSFGPIIPTAFTGEWRPRERDHSHDLPVEYIGQFGGLADKKRRISRANKAETADFLNAYAEMSDQSVDKRSKKREGEQRMKDDFWSM